MASGDLRGTSPAPMFTINMDAHVVAGMVLLGMRFVRDNGSCMAGGGRKIKCSHTVHYLSRSSPRIRRCRRPARVKFPESPVVDVTATVPVTERSVCVALKRRECIGAVGGCGDDSFHVAPNSSPGLLSSLPHAAGTRRSDLQAIRCPFRARKKGHSRE